jgi:hypothetical protein
MNVKDLLYLINSRIEGEKYYLSSLFVPTLFFNLAYRTASWIVSRISSIFLIKFCSFLVFLEFLSSRIISLANSLRARSIIFESTDRVLVKLSSCFETQRCYMNQRKKAIFRPMRTSENSSDLCLGWVSL